MTTIEALNGLCRWVMLMWENGKMWAYNSLYGFSQLNVGS